MDEARIRALTQEVLAQLGGPKDPVTSDLEARVAALEHALRALVPPSAAASAGAAAPQSPVVVALHPSHELLTVSGGAAEGRCLLEPGRACVGSGQCRTLGH